jgi:hypothetical protein
MIQNRYFADGFQDLDAVVPWEMEIEHDDAGMSFLAVLPLSADEFKRLLPVGDNLNFDRFLKTQKSYAEDFGIARIVIDQQDFRFWQGTLLMS